MPIIEESIVINREPKEVWDFASDYENLELTDSSQRDIKKLTDGPIDVGSRLSGVAKVMGRKIPWTNECTAINPPHSIRFESVEAPLRFAFDYTYDAVDGGTKVTIRCETESGMGGVFGKFGDGLVSRTYAKQLRANLETMKEILEAE